MGRSRRRKKTFKCGHRGFGQECNRCREANRLQMFAESKGKKKFQTFKKPNAPSRPKTWTEEELWDEVTRLREDGRKRI